MTGENQNNLYGLLMTITAQTYLFIVIARIGIPVMWHAFVVEDELTLRLRLAMLLGSQIGVELMAFHVVVQNVLVLLNIPPGHFGDGVTIFMVLTAFTIFASFLHVKVYIALARVIVYIRELLHLPRLLWLETSLSRALNVQPCDLSAYEVIHAPDYATYRVVIAILDRYRDLRLSPLASLQKMADALEKIGIRSMQYADLVKALQRVVIPA